MDSSACVEPAEPVLSGMFWKKRPSVVAFVAPDSVSPGPWTASLKATTPICCPASNCAPPSVDVNA